MERTRLSRLGTAGLSCLLASGAWAQGAPMPPAAGAAGAAAGAVTRVPASEWDVRAGVFKAVQGEVRVARADGRTLAAQAGQPVLPADRIRTGASGGASLLLRDGTTLVLGPQTQLDLKQYHFDAATEGGGMLLSLLRGSMRVISGLIAKTQPEAVRIDTPTTTIGIRGTDFIVVADAQP